MISLKKKLSLLFLLVLLPLVSAVQIDSGTIIQSVGLNTTLNFTSTFYADVIQTESNSIYLEKFRTTSVVGEYITMNITNEDMTGFNAPYISSSSTTSKTITSQLSQAINATVVVNVEDCPINAVYQGNAVTSTSCVDGDTAVFTLTNIPNGESILTLNTYSGQVSDELCVNLISSYGEFGRYIPTIFTVLAILVTMLIVGLLIFAVKEGIIDMSSFSMENSKEIMIGIFIIGVIIFSSIVIFASIC